MRPHTARAIQEKILELDHFIISTLIPGSYLNGLSFFLFLVFLNGKIFNSEEQITQDVENFFYSKLHFTKKELISCQEDEKRLYIIGHT